MIFSVNKNNDDNLNETEIKCLFLFFILFQLFYFMFLYLFYFKIMFLLYEWVDFNNPEQHT